MTSVLRADVVDDPTHADHDGVGGTAASRRQSLPRRVLVAAGPGRTSLLYVFAALIAVFGLWVPDLFFRMTTLKSTLADFSIVGIVALGLVVALAAGAFDLSVGATLGMATTVVTKLVHDGGVNTVVAVVIVLAMGAAIGTVNGLLVANLRVNAFIATLAMSSIVSAIVVIVSDNLQQFGLPEGFTRIAREGPLGIAWPFYYLLILAVLVWFVLQHTTVGRYVYATGGNANAARLAGVRTQRVVLGSLVTSSVLAAVAGIVLAAKINGSTPSLGPSFLLPAFAAAFLGSTQISPGRHNVWGTLLAIVVLGFGTKGFDLGGVEFWVKDLFYGGALLFAVSLAQVQGRLAARRQRARDVSLDRALDDLRIGD